MKALAWGSIITSFLIFAFVTFGYFSGGMDHVSTEEVDAPTEICWKFFQKVHRMDEWIEGFKKIEIIKGFPNKPGSTFRVTLERNGEDMHLIQTIRQFEVGKIISFDMENDQVFGHTEITFLDNPEHTQISYRQVLKGKNAVYNAVLELSEGGFIDQQNKNLHNLRKLIEATQ
jgi:hypothetical protein